MPPKNQLIQLFVGIFCESIYNFHNTMRLIAPHHDTQIKWTHLYSTKTLLTPSESRLFLSLAELAQGKCLIAPKPRLADFIQHYDLTGFNKISQKHIDFLICRIPDGTPMLAVELDDPSHDAPDRRRRDAEVNTLFAQVGIPLVRIDVTELTRVEKLLPQLDRAWNRRTETLMSLPPVPTSSPILSSSP
jgi:uncharacterized protein DUF2726